MDLQALKVFQAVSKMGSISGAARELNYAQSNITTKIQQLEKQLQTTLLHRHNRGILLTSKGKALLVYAEKIFHLFDEMNSVLKDDQTPKGPLLIGSMETTAAIRLPMLLSKYHRCYPNVDFTLVTGPTAQNIHGVLHYELDGAFVAGPIDHSEIIQETVFEENMVIVTDVNQPLLSSVQELENRTLLVFRSGCSYRRNMENWLSEEGVTPNKIMEFGTLDAIIGCVSAGLGISLLPYSVVAKYIREGILQQHAIPNPYAKVETLFIYRKDRYVSTSLMKFREMLINKVSMLQE